jgi:hypothetical protein
MLRLSVRRVREAGIVSGLGEDGKLAREEEDATELERERTLAVSLDLLSTVVVVVLLRGNGPDITGRRGVEDDEGDESEDREEDTGLVTVRDSHFFTVRAVCLSEDEVEGLLRRALACVFASVTRS